MATPASKPWYRRVWVWLLVALGIIVVVVAIGLQPFVRYETRRSLDNMKGYRGDFETTHVSLIPLRYTIRKLKLQQEGVPSWREPIFYAEQFAVGLDWGKLVRGKIVASVELNHAKIAMVKESKPAQKGASLSEQLSKLLPADLNRLEVKDGQVLYALGEERGSPQIWLHQIDATLENVATRANLAEGTTTLALKGKLQRTGDLSLFATADPLEKKLTFAGEAELKGLSLKELNSIMAAKTDVQMSQGKLDLFARFEAKGGALTGAVKPILKDAKVDTTSPKLGDKLKVALADAGLDLFSDRVPGRKAVATVIPIKGDLNQPELQLWPTILGILRNSFVEGVSESFRNLPPPTASKKEGPLTQARHALDKRGGVQAQPRKK